MFMAAPRSNGEILNLTWTPLNGAAALADRYRYPSPPRHNVRRRVMRARSRLITRVFPQWTSVPGMGIESRNRSRSFQVIF